MFYVTIISPNYNTKVLKEGQEHIRLQCACGMRITLSELILFSWLAQSHFQTL